MKEILLTKGKVAIVDDEDYERLNKSKWHCAGSRRNIYAKRRGIGKDEPRMVSMHNEIIIGIGEGYVVDHIDGDGLNNCKDNLRVCTLLDNSKNRRKKIGEFTSIHKGVFFQRKLWVSQIYISNKRINIGKYTTEIEAAIAYNIAAKEYHGEFANLNTIPNEYKDVVPVIYRMPHSSKYTGVCKRGNIWVAQIQCNGKKIHIGHYKTEDEAMLARKEAEEKYFGEFASKEVI